MSWPRAGKGIGRREAIAGWVARANVENHTEKDWRGRCVWVTAVRGHFGRGAAYCGSCEAPLKVDNASWRLEGGWVVARGGKGVARTVRTRVSELCHTVHRVDDCI